MTFAHCDCNETCLSLHDCTAEQVYFEDGKLGFAFPDGFWVSPEHPESHLSNIVRTDRAKVEYTWGDGAEYDITIYVYEKNIFKKTIRVEWTLGQLLREINSGKCKLEFLYQYVDFHARIVECELVSSHKPYRRECMMKVSAPKVHYFWNHLREDRPW